MKSVVVVVALLSLGATQSQVPSQLTLRCNLTSSIGQTLGAEVYSIDFDRRMWCRMVAQQCERLNDLYRVDTNRITLSAGVEIDRMTGHLTDVIKVRNGQCSPVAYQPLPSRQRF